MDKEFLGYVKIFLPIASAVWIVLVFIRDRRQKLIELSSGMVTRLLEGDKLTIENPDIQKYLSQNAEKGEEYFRKNEVLKMEIFYKAKTKVYRELNFFDEILSISKQYKHLGFLNPSGVIEISDWKTYIKEKLAHPLYRSILNKEGHIFGDAFQEFWKMNKEEIENKKADPFMW